jgi:hypothetical protein
MRACPLRVARASIGCISFGNVGRVRISADMGGKVMERLFAVTESRGASWNGSRAIEEQEDWPAHATFMNGLEAERFVLLGGLLEGTTDFC